MIWHRNGKNIEVQHSKLLVWKCYSCLHMDDPVLQSIPFRRSSLHADWSF